MNYMHALIFLSVAGSKAGLPLIPFLGKILFGTKKHHVGKKIADALKDQAKDKIKDEVKDNLNKKKKDKNKDE